MKGATRLASKPLEFERFKTWIAQFFPKTQEFNGAATAHPVVDDGKRFLRIPIPGDVGQRDVVLIVLIQDRNGRALDFNGASGCFAHGMGYWVGIRLIPQAEA
jgi:hypothetical protein